MKDPAQRLNHYRLPELAVFCCEYPAAKDDDALTATKLSRLAEMAIDIVVDLTTPHDGLVPYDLASYHRDARNALGAQRRSAPEHWRRPIPDAGTPASLDAFAQLVEEIATAIADGRRIAIHCWGGIGRTGMVAAALLVRFGWTADDALEIVDALWRSTPKARRPEHAGRSAPETPVQVAMVRDYATQARALPRQQAPRSPASRVTAQQSRGCLVGGAIGDALGSAVEFTSWSEIRRLYGPEGVTDLVPSYGLLGAITDDTQMSLFTAEGVLRASARVDAPEAVVAAIWYGYQRWLYTQGWPADARALDTSRGGATLLAEPGLYHRRAPGNTCISALRMYAMRTVGGDRAPNASKGCGTVMRVAPIGLHCAPEVAYQIGVESSWLTHGHVTGFVAGGAFAMLISLVTEGVPLRDAVQQVRGRVYADVVTYESEDVMTVVRAIDQGVARAQHGVLTAVAIESLGGGWVAEEALAIAIACALAHEGDVPRALLAAVNHSGDSDSTGSMVGQLLGAMVGWSALPAAWRQAIEPGIGLYAVADSLAIGHESSEWWRRRWPAE
jgi:ADP-ribosylglycohydrolase